MPHPPTIMMPTTTVAGTIMKAGSTPLAAKDTWTPSTGESGTTAREEGAVEGARTEPQSARRDPGGRGAVNEPWTPVKTVTGTPAEDAALGTTTVWRTSTTEETEEEEEDSGIGAGTI